MIGEYKLAKVKNGVGYFAYVFVVVEPSLTGETVIDEIGQQVDREKGEVNSRTHNDWINAAIDGVYQTLDHLKSLTSSDCYLVKVSKVIGTEVDTTEDSVKVAASIATWRAIKPNFSEPIPKFDQLENIWTVEFPSLV
ncbi:MULTISPECIES: hypothetical protein [Pseudanabaena]|jgi:hypothetical protein|uniref:Uncharacterized protein n=2 Tax=Pseudanabaena TaxID=1152 RepID=L8MVE4_9CYAN|nr:MULTISPECIES: hypothetical protein [Pseudanabaena]ELS30440.1 hypothetical protein Pse7429DRAFT_4543 [Pseudanabaena biceps PCC 7429]MDG3497285.1 hypothetical protein [Pseudanabaena catenata USMAC16]